MLDSEEECASSDSNMCLGFDVVSAGRFDMFSFISPLLGGLPNSAQHRGERKACNDFPISLIP